MRNACLRFWVPPCNGLSVPPPPPPNTKPQISDPKKLRKKASTVGGSKLHGNFKRDTYHQILGFGCIEQVTRTTKTNT